MHEDRLVINIPAIISGIKFLWRRITCIIVFCIFAVCVIGYIRQEIVYVSEAELYYPPVNSKSKITQKTLELNAQVMSDFAEIAESALIQKRVAEMTEIPYEEIKASVRAWHDPGTTVLHIRCTSENIDDPKTIVQWEVKCIAEYAEKELGISNLKILGDATDPVEEGHVSLWKQAASGMGLRCV